MPSDISLFRNRTAELESFAFRTNNIVQTLSNELSKVKALIRRKTTSLESRLEKIEQQQESILKAQTEQTNKINYLSAQLGSIDGKLDLLLKAMEVKHA